MPRRVQVGHLLPVGCGVAVGLIILLIVGRDYPFVGDDHRYFIPRLLDTDLHLRINGLAVQVLAAFQLDTSYIATALSRLTGASVQVGVWELDCGLSPVLLVLLSALVAKGVSSVQSYGLPGLTGRSVRALSARILQSNYRNPLWHVDRLVRARVLAAGCSRDDVTKRPYTPSNGEP